jgi:hypothetical protein
VVCLDGKCDDLFKPPRIEILFYLFCEKMSLFLAHPTKKRKRK